MDRDTIFCGNLFREGEESCRLPVHCLQYSVSEFYHSSCPIPRFNQSSAKAIGRPSTRDADSCGQHRDRPTLVHQAPLSRAGVPAVSYPLQLEGTAAGLSPSMWKPLAGHSPARGSRSTHMRRHKRMCLLQSHRLLVRYVEGIRRGKQEHGARRERELQVLLGLKTGIDG